MRIFIVALTLLVLTALPAAAQNEQNPGGGHVFGSSNCSQRLQCDGTGASSADVINMANACITRFFGYVSNTGFFDTTASLDNNNCLTGLTNVIPKGVGQQLQPVCCILQLPDTSCTLHCNLVTVQ